MLCVERDAGGADEGVDVLVRMGRRQEDGLELARSYEEALIEHRLEIARERRLIADGRRVPIAHRLRREEDGRERAEPVHRRRDARVGDGAAQAARQAPPRLVEPLVEPLGLLQLRDLGKARFHRDGIA